MNPPQRDHEPTVPLCTVPSSQNQNHVVPLRFLPAALRACRALGAARTALHVAVGAVRALLGATLAVVWMSHGEA